MAQNGLECAIKKLTTHSLPLTSLVLRSQESSCLEWLLSVVHCLLMN